MPPPVSAKPTIHILLGPTASGKTEVAVRLAERLNAEVISADSMKVYRGLDIGTAKPDAELQQRFAFHLIDIRDPDEAYDAKQFVADADRLAVEIAGRGKNVLIEGGTALYLKCFIEGIFDGPAADPSVRAELEAYAALHGLEELHGRLALVDPVTANRLHPNDIRRVVRALEVHRLTGHAISEQQQQFGARRETYSFNLAGLTWPRETLYARCDTRVGRMMELGFLAEVRGLLDHSGGIGRHARQALGYKQLIEHLENDAELESMISQIQQSTRRFARRQMMWFRRFDRTEWIDMAEGDEPEAVAEEIHRRWQEVDST